MPLRPMTVTDVLDGAIAVIKAAPRTVFAIAAAIVVPYELVVAFLQRDQLRDRGLGGVLSVFTSTSDSTTTVRPEDIIVIVLGGLALSLVAAAVARVVSAWYADAHIGPGAALSAATRRFPALFVAWIVVHVCEWTGFLGLVVGALFLMPLFAVVVPAIVVEHLGPWKGVRRSMRLTSRRYGAVLLATILVAVVDLVLTVALSGVGLAFTFFDWGWIVATLCWAGASLVTFPFVAAAATLLYFDLRVRAEGLDIELGIAAAFPPNVGAMRGLQPLHRTNIPSPPVAGAR